MVMYCIVLDSTSDFSCAHTASVTRIMHSEISFVYTQGVRPITKKERDKQAREIGRAQKELVKQWIADLKAEHGRFGDDTAMAVADQLVTGQQQQQQQQYKHEQLSDQQQQQHQHYYDQHEEEQHTQPLPPPFGGAQPPHAHNDVAEEEEDFLYHGEEEEEEEEEQEEDDEDEEGDEGSRASPTGDMMEGELGSRSSNTIRIRTKVCMA